MEEEATSNMDNMGELGGAERNVRHSKKRGQSGPE